MKVKLPILLECFQWWLILLSTSLCVFTLPDQSLCNVWWVWHAKQEMLTPQAPDVTLFWGFILLHGLDFFTRFCLCPLNFMQLGYGISEFVLFWICSLRYNYIWYTWFCVTSEAHDTFTVIVVVSLNCWNIRIIVKQHNKTISHKKDAVETQIFIIV